MRRFIAGAVCPQCRAMDRIVVEEIEGGRRRLCVSCGHSDSLDTGSAVEPSRRFERRPQSEIPATPVRVVEPPKRKS